MWTSGRSSWIVLIYYLQYCKWICTYSMYVSHCTSVNIHNVRMPTIKNRLSMYSWLSVVLAARSNECLSFFTYCIQWQLPAKLPFLSDSKMTYETWIIIVVTSCLFLFQYPAIFWTWFAWFVSNAWRPTLFIYCLPTDLPSGHPSTPLQKSSHLRFLRKMMQKEFPSAEQSHVRKLKGSSFHPSRWGSIGKIRDDKYIQHTST